jgi:GNAT superfamily N-acetyltransferase
MTLSEGLHDVPAGMLAAVVTSLEMFARPEPRGEPSGMPWEFRRAEAPGCDWYRELFRRIGQEYLWTARLEISDASLRALLDDPLVEVYSLVQAGRDEALVELDFRVANECELTVFGVTAPLLGSGAARWVMNRAIKRAWSETIERLWVHTCTLDHEAALPFYIHSGFRAFKREVEIVADPRRTGVLPPGAAAGVPLL